MTLDFNLAGSQFCEYAKPELEYVGTPCHLVWDRENKFDTTALSVRTDKDEEHVGYVPADSYKFKGHQALYDALLLEFTIRLEITEAVFKKDGRFNRKGRGAFTHFAVKLTLEAGDDSADYKKGRKKYLRLTRIIDQFKWDPEDDSLMEWAVSVFKDYKEYRTYLDGCCIDGQLIHAKAERALYKMPLPEGVSPLPERVVEIIKKVKKVHVVEGEVFDETLRVAGHDDALVDMRPLYETDDKAPVLTTLDWKRSKVCSPKYLRQVAFYAKNRGAKQAVVVLARGEEPVVLTEQEIDKYYDEVKALAKFVWSCKK
jgi:hypothetical protein